MRATFIAIFRQALEELHQDSPNSGAFPINVSDTLTLYENKLASAPKTGLLIRNTTKAWEIAQTIQDVISESWKRSENDRGDIGSNVTADLAGTRTA